MFLSISFSCFTELNTANQKNRLSREKACVAFWDEIPSTQPKDDTNERQTLPNKEEAPIDNLQSWSSSLSDPDFTGVVSEVERYSDDRESTGTSRASKESTPSDVSGVSLDPKSISFSQIKSDRKPVVKSCNTEASLPLSTGADKTVRRWLIDPRLYLVSKDNMRLNRARRCADFVPVFIGPGISILNHVLTFFLDLNFRNIFLARSELHCEISIHRFPSLTPVHGCCKYTFIRICHSFCFIDFVSAR